MTRADADRSWFATFLGRLLLWLPLAFLAWWLTTPLYNAFLAEAGENLSRMTERPGVTRIVQRDRHYALVDRSDAPSRSLPYSVRLTDIHYPAILLAALVLATPGASYRRRFSALGSSLVILAVFHLVDLFFWVKFVYATQLGAWSMDHYGPLARNLYGMGKHLLDLPVKLGLPLLLWVVLFWRELTSRYEI